MRKTIKTADFVTYIEDILFWLLAGVLILYFIFTYNNGEIRFYMFIAILLGILLYISLISKFFIKTNVTIINFIKMAIITIFTIILMPFKFLLKLIMRIFKPIFSLIRSFKENLTKFIQKIIDTTKSTKIYNKFVKKSKKEEGFRENL